MGVDVGTRVAIYDFIRDALRGREGDPADLLGPAGGAAPLPPGLCSLPWTAVQAELAGDEITEQNVLKHFFEREAA